MGNYQHSKDDMRADVKAYVAKQKSIKTICADRGICRKTFYNWIDYFKKKEKHLFLKNEGAAKARRKNSQDIGSQNLMLKSAVNKIVPEAIQRKLVQNIVRRFSVTVEEACNTVGIDFEKYGYKPRVPEIDDQMVINAITDELTINPQIPLYNTFNAILAKYPNCPSKQMKRICKENKSAFDIYRNKVKNDIRRAEKIKRQNAKVYRKSDSWVMYVHEFQLSKGILIGENQFSSQATVMFLFDSEIKYLLNYSIDGGYIKPGDVFNFLKMCTGKNGTPEKIVLNEFLLKLKETLDFQKNVASTGFKPLLYKTLDGALLFSKIKRKIQADLLITSEIELKVLVEKCENWRNEDSTK
jgi:hypothetical protein